MLGLQQHRQKAGVTNFHEDCLFKYVKSTQGESKSIDLEPAFLYITNYASHYTALWISKWWITLQAWTGGIRQASVVIRHWQFKAQLHEGADSFGFPWKCCCGGVNQMLSGGSGGESLMHTLTSPAIPGSFASHLHGIAGLLLLYNTHFIFAYVCAERADGNQNSWLCGVWNHLPSRKNRNLEGFFVSGQVWWIWIFKWFFSKTLFKNIQVLWYLVVI